MMNIRNSIYKKFKKLVIFLIGFTGILLAIASTSSFSSTEASASSQIKQILAPVQSLTAKFQQRMTNDKGDVLQSTEGNMWLKKPGQFRWEVNGQDKRLVVSNGKQVWDYDQDLEQVTIQRFSKGETKAPIFFLTGDVNSLDRDFTIEAIHSNASASGKCMKESNQCFILKPKSEQSVFQTIHIGFKDNLLKEMEMLDQLNQHSYFIFNNTQLNPTISPKLFQFVPPKGVDVVGA